KDRNLTEEDRYVIAAASIHRFAHILGDKQRVYAKVFFEFFIRNDGVALKADADDLNIPQLRCALRQLPQQEVRCGGTAMNKYPVPWFDNANGFFSCDVFHVSVFKWFATFFLL